MLWNQLPLKYGYLPGATSINFSHCINLYKNILFLDCMVSSLIRVSPKVFNMLLTFSFLEQHRVFHYLSFWFCFVYILHLYRFRSPAFKVKRTGDGKAFTGAWRHVDSLLYPPFLCCQDRDGPPWQEEPATDAITPYWFKLKDSLCNHEPVPPPSPYRHTVINCIVFLSAIYSISLQWPRCPTGIIMIYLVWHTSMEQVGSNTVGRPMQLFPEE